MAAHENVVGPDNKFDRSVTLAVENETQRICSFLGSRTVRRVQGEALHPERESLAVLQKIRQVQGEYNFAGAHINKIRFRLGQA